VPGSGPPAGSPATPPSSSAPRRDRSVRIAAAVIALLALAAAALVLFAVNRPEPPAWVPTPVGALGDADPSGARVTTVDASSPDHWRFFSFDRGVLAGRAAGLDWDLAFRRFHIIVNGGDGFAGRGGIVDLGAVSFDSIHAVPPAAFEPTTIAGRDSVNRVIDRWYRYGFTSHLLTPLGHVYLVRPAEGGPPVQLVILGYYCPRATPGCVTFRWARPGER
jgi:hypothetical protein